jgi:hypothetical protein
MIASEFDKLVEDRLGFCRGILQSKAREYATEDRLHNFKVTGSLQDIEPETARMGMMAKHIVSLVDIVGDIEKRKTIPVVGLISEKITDVINYALLLEALIEERREAEKK